MLELAVIPKLLRDIFMCLTHDYNGIVDPFYTHTTAEENNKSFKQGMTFEYS